jgi:predicted acyl esterase
MPSAADEPQGGTGSEPLPAEGPSILPDRYQNATMENLDFSSSDGTEIHATVYLPAEPRAGFTQQTRFGTLVNFSPWYAVAGYGDTDSRLSGTQLNKTGTFGFLISHGFAIAVASVPGTGHSGGCYGLGGLHDQQVMAEFVDWTAAQPWSNGNVGMTGGGDDGTTQWMAAVQHPAALKTIVPHVALSDLYGFLFQDGAAYSEDANYVAERQALQYGLEVRSAPPEFYPEPAMVGQRVCPDVAAHLASATEGRVMGQYDDFWKERDYTQHVSDITASVLVVAGLEDWWHKPDQTLVWDGLRSEKSFWLQQMGSFRPYATNHEAWNRLDYNPTVAAWYDHYLNGAENGIPSRLPAVQVQDQTGYWRNETRWPPVTQASKLYLGDGALVAAASPGQTIVATAPGAYDASAFDDPQLPDAVAAKFLTAPLAEPLRFSGPPNLDLSLMVDRPGNAHITAQLWAVHADGSWNFLTLGGRGLAQRDGRDRYDPPLPMQSLHVPVSFSPVDAYLAAGDRLAVTIAGENHWFTPTGNAPTYIIDHSSSLTLPVLPPEAPRGLETAAVMAANPYFAVAPAS